MAALGAAPGNATPIREQIGIAIDGGGVRGAIVAKGLIALEEVLGTRPLIHDPRLRVLAGTSTGSLIVAALAAGLTGEQIFELYRRLGREAFSKAGPLRPFGQRIPLLSRARLPIGVVRFLQGLPLGVGELLLYLLMPARYSFDPLRLIIRQLLDAHPELGPDPTLGELGRYLRTLPGQPALIITAVEVAARETRFLKTSAGGDFERMTLADALLASSSIPTYFEPIPVPAAEPGRAPTRWLVDGGVGSFGNPALVVAREMLDARSTAQPYDPAAVTLFSFGTGYVPTEVYDRAYGSPAGWWAIEWAERVTDLFTDDAIREQTRSIPAQYPGVDLRRFQVTLDRVVDPDRFDLIDSYLAEKGEELRRLVLEQRHALALPESGAAHDPEHLLDPATAALLRRTLPG